MLVLHLLLLVFHVTVFAVPATVGNVHAVDATHDFYVEPLLFMLHAAVMGACTAIGVAPLLLLLHLLLMLHPLL